MSLWVVETSVGHFRAWFVRLMSVTGVCFDTHGVCSGRMNDWQSLQDKKQGSHFDGLLDDCFVCCK